MAKESEPMIDISELVELCARGVGQQELVRRAITGWFNTPDKARVRELAIGGGGTAVLLPREDVKDMFRLGIIAINEEKIATGTFAKKFAEFKERHGLTDEDLGLKKPAA